MIRQSYRVIIAILMGFVACVYLRAQPYCRVHTFDIHDGLPSNSIAGLAQSHDNLLWVSTWNGLCYYDGYQFTTYRDGGDNGTLSSNRLRTVEPDGNGHVWLFSYDRVLHVLDMHTGRYTNLSDIIARKTGSEFLGRNSYAAAGHMWITGDGTPLAVRASVCDPLNPDSLEVYDASRYHSGSKLVNKVIYDRDGNEWVLSDKGIHLYGTDVWQRGRFIDVCTIGGLAYMATSDGHLYAYGHQGRSLRPMPSPQWMGRVNCMVGYDDRNLLLGTDNGIAVYNVAARAWRHIARGNVGQIHVDSQGRIWVFSDAPGVLLTDIHGAEDEVFVSSPEGDACTGSIKPVWVEDKYGVVWVVPVGGVFGYFDENARRIVPYPLESPRFGRKSIPDIEKYYVDSQCNMWITSPHDLILINFGRYNVMRLPLVQNADTRSLVALADGTVLAGSHTGVIGCFDTEGRLKGYLARGEKVSLSDRPVKFSERIYVMYQDSRGRLWIGTKGYGLYMVDTDGRVRHYEPSAADKYAINSENVYDVDQSPSGRIWIATYGGGVNYVDESADGRIRFINASNDMTSYPIDLYANSRRITHTLDGVLLLSTTGGLLTFSDSVRQPSAIKFFKTNHVSGDVTSLRTNDVMQVLAARDGTVYVTTMGGEMQRVTDTELLHDGLKFASMSRGSDGRHMSYYAPEGGGIRSMIEDADGNICVVRETSLVLYDVARDSMTVYGPNDLGENLEFTEALPELIPSTGCMWLPTVGGIVSFHPNDITKSDFSPNIVFTGVQFQGESEKHHILNTDRIDVDVDRRNLAISFAALDFSDKYLLQYAYRLDDDKEWNYLQGSNTVQFTGLGPGLHRLHVKSTNSDGVWLDNESAIDIYVKPSFSETPWAILLYVLIATFVVWAAMHFYFLRKRNAMLSDLRHKESEFYTDVSHKLRTPLTLIGAPVKEVLASESLSDTARGHLEMVERNSGRMLTLVDEMLRKSHDKGVYISDETAMNVNVPSSPADTGVNAVSEASSQPGRSDMADDPSRDTILVVEDNDDLRSFLTDILSSQYNVLSASNGREGLETAEARQPDFILTDVTMPEMDGLTMVRNIKSNKHLSHIPIIVLSAKASEQDRVLGLREGIDDYVTKPFSATYLRQRIANIIAQRHMLQQSYLESLGAGNVAAVVQEPLPADEGDVTPEEMAKVSSEATAGPAEYRLDSPQVVDADKEMMATLMAFINDHLDEEGLKIEELADAVNLGRTVFYGKIKALVGMTPSDFLRRMRMQRAEELIVKTRMNFSEIAFKVGFSDPKYFTKCFKKETGMTPSEYRQKSL
ncbi:response regulator [Muribaculaceae bacterium Isolate-110 (HZI)]|nr:response regulator [Muribaculaceae bacterium Isolate-110 (HZI)]